MTCCEVETKIVSSSGKRHTVGWLCLATAISSNETAVVFLRHAEAQDPVKNESQRVRKDHMGYATIIWSHNEAQAPRTYIYIYIYLK